MQTQPVAETIGRACKLRPALKPLLEAFEPLFSARRAAAEKLGPLLSEAGIRLPGNADSEPILASGLPSGLGPYVRKAAEDLMPLLTCQEAIRPFAEQLANLFLNAANDADRESLTGGLLSENPDGLVSMANKYVLEPQVLDFASSFIVSAVLRALAQGTDAAQFEDWLKPDCPVCGQPPIIAWLGRRPMATGNEFLTDGGGKKYLHCGMCGANWHFLRGVCPGCGTHGQDAMQIYGEEDRRHERIDWCKKCRCYLPQIDLREIAGTPDMDAMALCLLHLDIVAAEKELTPLKPSFWNMF